MDHPIVVHVFQADQNACHEKFGLLFCELFFLVEVIAEVTASHQICHKVQILIVREGIEHIYQEPKHHIEVKQMISYGCFN